MEAKTRPLIIVSILATIQLIASISVIVLMWRSLFDNYFGGLQNNGDCIFNAVLFALLSIPILLIAILLAIINLFLKRNFWIFSCTTITFIAIILPYFGEFYNGEFFMAGFQKKLFHDINQQQLEEIADLIPKNYNEGRFPLNAKNIEDHIHFTQNEKELQQKITTSIPSIKSVGDHLSVDRKNSCVEIICGSKGGLCDVEWGVYILDKGIQWNPNKKDYIAIHKINDRIFVFFH